ncbi:ATP-binding protein [Streptomyces sp. NPDC005970]|uniref:ATP-binding protein n=1 Tax=Streptomyces sp. NPDC005970 TaxID=3156723 RepID=UPI0033CE48A4
MNDVTEYPGTSTPDEPPLGAMTLRPWPESVPRARHWFRKFAAAYNLACPIDDCLLMITEVVTNAIVFGKAEDDWLVRVEWHRDGRALRVEVHNPGFPANVRMREAAAHEAHGRGLFLVNALADSWHAGPSRFGGTVVSFTLQQAWPPGPVVYRPRSAHFE